jgi:hypothetical protein
MVNPKRPKRANDTARPKLSAVANILAQSTAVSGAFGRAAGFVLMMIGLFVDLSARLTIILVVGKGAGFAVGSLAKLWF